MGKQDKTIEQETQENRARSHGDGLSRDQADPSEEFLEEPITTRFSFEIRIGLAVLGVLGFILAAVVAYRLMTLRPKETASVPSDQSAATEKTDASGQIGDGAGEKKEKPSPSLPQTESTGSNQRPVAGSEAQSPPGTAVDVALTVGGTAGENDRHATAGSNAASQMASHSETAWPVVPPLNLNDGPTPREESNSPPGAPFGSASLNSGYHAPEPNQPVATEQSQAVPPLPFGQPGNTAGNGTNESSDLPDQGFTAGWSLSGPGQNSQAMANDPIAIANSSTSSGMARSSPDAGGQSTGATKSLDYSATRSGGMPFGQQSETLPGSVPGDFFAGAPPLSSAAGNLNSPAQLGTPNPQQSQWPTSPSPPFGAQSGVGSIPAQPSQLPVAEAGNPVAPSGTGPTTMPPAWSGTAMPAGSSAIPSTPPLVADRGATTPPFSTNSTVSRRTYTVQQGETLFDIARQQLGKASRWVEIYQLNRDLLGEKLENFRPGMTLLLPEEPVSAQATGHILRQ